MTDTRDGHRRLARSLAPLPEESLPGFLLRLSYRLESSPRRITELLGLGQHHNRIAYAHLRSLSADLVPLFAHRAQMSIQEANALTLQRFAKAYPALGRFREVPHRIGSTAPSHWAMAPSSRFCPQCLRGNNSPVQNALGGAWQLRWHLPIVFACVRHKRLLKHTCPSCELPLNSPESKRPGLLKRPNTAGLHPLQCRNRSVAAALLPDDTTSPFATPTSCGARLDAPSADTGAAISAEELEQLLTLQQRIDRNLTPRQEDSEFHPPSDPFYFPDLITAAHLIKLSWPAGRELLPSEALATALDTHAAPVVSAVASQSSNSTTLPLRGTRAAPEDPTECGALLLAAHNLLGDREPRTMAERVDPIAFEAFQRAKRFTRKLLLEGGISPNLTSATSARSPGFRLRGRIQNSSYVGEFSIDEVPPYLPRDWYLEHFTDLRQQLPDATYRDDRLFRRAASFRLAELATGRAWPECAEMLGICSSLGKYVLHSIGNRLAANRLWPAFTQAVHQVAEQLSGSVDRPNYANRRRRLASWRMHDSHWSRLFEDLPRLAHMRATTDPRIASIIVWSEATRSEAPRCPIVQKVRGTEEARLLTCGTSPLHEADLGHGERIRWRNRLTLYAMQVGTACDQNRLLRVSVRKIIEQETRMHGTADPQLA
ncbi:TniQ family protein [Streptomyces sp. NPDC001817]|uniref:TniQ family protein n=1 Tax=Streptomyces sp. NPDC001817 TaxID=3154398 RepID=UPI0033246C98